jgi:hypothetical protein
MQVQDEIANEFAHKLLPTVVAAADNVLRYWTRFFHERDDLIGIGSLVLARIISRLPAEATPDAAAIDGLKDLVFVSGRRAMRYYLKKLKLYSLTTWEPPARISELEYLCRHAETLEALLTVCLDTKDHEIIRGREDGLTMAEIGLTLGIHKSEVCRRLAEIWHRYQQIL